MFFFSALFIAGPQNSSAFYNVNSGCMLQDCHSAPADAGLHTSHSNLPDNCTSCHTGPPPPKKGDVLSSTCSFCHVLDAPGKCSVVNLAAHQTGVPQACAAGPCHGGVCAPKTTSSSTTTTTTTPCPAQKVLGEDNPALDNLRDFRDGKLAQNAIGRKVIQIYYNNADSINDALERNPALRAAARRVLEMISPMVGEN